MPKTKEELEVLKKEFDSLNSKLKDLNEEELIAVVGGEDSDIEVKFPDNSKIKVVSGPLKGMHGIIKGHITSSISKGSMIYYCMLEGHGCILALVCEKDLELE